MWRAAHSDRTLRALGVKADPVRKATVRMTQAPQKGWTLRYHRGVIAPVAHTPLMKLVEAERRAENHHTLPAKAGAPPKPTPAALRTLRDKAFAKRKIPKGSRDISKQVYEWTRANPDKQYLD